MTSFPARHAAPRRARSPQQSPVIPTAGGHLFLSFDGGVDGHALDCARVRADRGSIAKVRWSLNGVTRGVSLNLPPGRSRYQVRPVESLSVMAGLPLPPTGRVLGHGDLLTYKPEFLGVITPPIASEFSGSFSLLNRVFQHSVQNIFELFQVTSSVRFQTSDEGVFLCRKNPAIFPRSHARI